MRGLIVVEAREGDRFDPAAFDHLLGRWVPVDEGVVGWVVDVRVAEGGGSAELTVEIDQDGDEGDGPIGVGRWVAEHGRTR